jgi:hypothetical protein
VVGVTWRCSYNRDHRRTRQGAGGQLPPNNFGKPWKFGQTLGKIKKIRADLSENMLKSGYFITILRKNSGKLSTPPPPPRKHQPRSPMIETLRFKDGDGEKQTPSNKW